MTRRFRTQSFPSEDGMVSFGRSGGDIRLTLKYRNPSQEEELESPTMQTVNAAMDRMRERSLVAMQRIIGALSEGLLPQLADEGGMRFDIEHPIERSPNTAQATFKTGKLKIKFRPFVMRLEQSGTHNLSDRFLATELLRIGVRESVMRIFEEYDEARKDLLEDLLEY